MVTKIGTFGDDTLIGVNGTDNLIFGDTDGSLSGGSSTAGNDTLIGGKNATNTLIGDADSMASPVTGGNDTLTGGIGGANTLIGDAVHSTGAAPTGGNDRLISADHTTDDMWGDFQSVSGGPPTGGHDTFVFSQHNGDDIIHDFQQGIDAIEINTSPFPTQAAEHIPPQAGSQFLETFTDLNIQEVDANTDGLTDSVIHFDANNSVTVLGVTGLTANDFHFVV
jgi:Ca2+-binding RTX toxin-like protein